MNYDNAKKLLTVQNVIVEYKNGKNNFRAIDDVSFDVYENEFVVVLGKSGCGKTTLLNVIGSLLTPKSGKVLFKGEDILKFNNISKLKYRRHSIGYIFQKFNLVNGLTVKENIELAASLIDNPGDIDEILKMLELSEYKTSYPSKMSGGQQQRASIARALIKNTDLLLCDEPTGALDTKNAFTVVKALQELTDTNKSAVVMITHNPDYVEYADRVIVLEDGKIKSEHKNNDKTIIYKDM